MEKADIDYTLYLCTDRSLMKTETLAETVEQAILGGCSVVQLREKECDTKEFFQMAKGIKQVTDKYNIPLIINDRIDIMLAVDAAGVHLGQEDMPLKEARRIVGENKIIGVSAHNLTEAQKAWEEGADYLGVGAIFGTKTKKNTVDTSIDTLKEICEKVKIPVVAIGGVGLSNIPCLKGTGISGVAVVSAIMAAENVKEAAAELVKKVGEV